MCAGQAVASFPTRGLEDGFCLTFVHKADGCQLDLDERGVRVASEELVCSFGFWREVIVSLVNGSISVTHDGKVAMRVVPLSKWLPTKEFEIGFASRRSTVLVDDSRSWLRGVRILAGSLLSAAEAYVEVSLNGQEFTNGSSVPFTYLAEPHLATIEPTSGPVGGDTLVTIGVRAPSAFSNASALRCRFSHAATPTEATWQAADGLLRCRTPPSVGALAGRVVTTLSMIVDGYLLDDGDGVAFTYYQPAALMRVWPDSGPVDGATEIVIQGTHLSSGMFTPTFCRFGSDIVPATAELLSESVRCTTPRSVNGSRTVPIEVSLNGQQYHDAASVVTFNFYETPRIFWMSPSSGTILGQTLVTIVGSGFTRAFNNLCRWDGVLTTNISSINSTHIECASPRIAAGRRPVEVTMNGQQYTSDGHTFSFYLDPHVRRLSVPGVEGEIGSYQDPKVTMPSAGYTMVRVWGTGFMGGTDYRCRINDAEKPIEATYDSSLDCLLCWSNQWKDEVHNSVEVTLNGREYTKDNVTVFINFFW